MSDPIFVSSPSGGAEVMRPPALWCWLYDQDRVGRIATGICVSCIHRICGVWRAQAKRQKCWPTAMRLRYHRRSAQSAFAPEERRRYIRGGMAFQRWINVPRALRKHCGRKTLALRRQELRS